MKKTTATMTWLHNGNYGTLLQAYALQRVIEQNGYENVIIDYAPSKWIKVINLFVSGNSLKLFYYKFRGFLNLKASRSAEDNFHQGLRRQGVFNDFIEHKLKKTKPYHSPHAMNELQGKYDVYICGSDQIWNPDYLNPPYFLNYLTEKDKKVAYAPSFGVKSIIGKKNDIIKKFLSQFSHLSFREYQGVEILQGMGLDTSKAEVVLDPTMLIERDMWEKFAVEQVGEKEPYILCYFLHDNPTYWKVVRGLSDKLGYRVIIIPVAIDAYVQNYEKRVNAGPEEWIGLVKNAKVILTDSFHCVLFSLLFHIDFYVFKRFADDDPASQNSRIEDILSKMNLEDRLLSMNERMVEFNSINNFEHIDKILNEERKKSIQYLVYAIEN